MQIKQSDRTAVAKVLLIKSCGSFYGTDSGIWAGYDQFGNLEFISTGGPPLVRSPLVQILLL